MLLQSRIVNQDYEEGKRELIECYKKTKAASNKLNYYVGEDSDRFKRTAKQSPGIINLTQG